MRTALFISMLLILPSVHGQEPANEPVLATAREPEPDPTLELLEALGGMDEEVSDEEVDLIRNEGKINREKTPKEVKDHEYDEIPLASPVPSFL